MNNLTKMLAGAFFLLSAGAANAYDIKSHISLKQPGNAAVTYQLNSTEQSELPVTITTSERQDGNDIVYTVKILAKKRIYFNYGAELNTGYTAGDCEYYLPGFWYHRNLRSPKEAPSFHTSKAWNFREDRLSSPLTSVFNGKTGQSTSVLRQIEDGGDALTTHAEGEVILSGTTTLGYLGLDGEGAVAKLTFGYPYVETPRRYIRKLTLAPSVKAFAKLEPGEVKTLSWRIRSQKADSYGQFVSQTWEYCFDQLSPKPIKPLYSAEQMKNQLANYFRLSFVDKYPLKFNSGHGLRIDDCLPVPIMQVGFCGRVLLNAFNALEYGEASGQEDLVKNANAILESFLANGFTKAGYFYDDIDFGRGMPRDEDVVHSIRQQSEGIYAILLYLKYEKEHGRKHKEWEQKMRTLLDNFVVLLKEDGHYARKFHDNGVDIDASGGSTPSATSALVMGYKYFGDKRYLAAAKRTVGYLEQNIISKSDYFSSTLDANCEDKEAAISAVTATYYLAMVTKKQERQHYISLCRQAAYFALSWYYLWDVPFAQGQMLGDLGFRSRGWSNVSVENNHVDVFVFELAHIVKWLGEVEQEPRFMQMNDLIYSSLNQLLPVTNRLCGIGVEGFNPEVVQHTTWDYGRNGKGYYNDIFAPGWTVASLWELYSPQRTVNFLK
ncbi:MAG: hypothetical protein IJ196_00955 [Prevotella sp.]|nr:hypothetical protein [Prevotella sp.]